MTNDELKRFFGLRVQALRRRRGLTQEELAEAIGRSVDTISNIERGFSSTRIETAQTIADTIGVSLSELFELDESAGDRGREHRQAMERVIQRIKPFSPKTIMIIANILDNIVDLSENIPKGAK